MGLTFYSRFVLAMAGLSLSLGCGAEGDDQGEVATSANAEAINLPKGKLTRVTFDQIKDRAACENMEGTVRIVTGNCVATIEISSCTWNGTTCTCYQEVTSEACTE